MINSAQSSGNKCIFAEILARPETANQLSFCHFIIKGSLFNSGGSISNVSYLAKMPPLMSVIGNLLAR